MARPASALGLAGLLCVLSAAGCRLPFDSVDGPDLPVGASVEPATVPRRQGPMGCVELLNARVDLLVKAAEACFRSAAAKHTGSSKPGSDPCDKWNDLLRSENAELQALSTTAEMPVVRCHARIKEFVENAHQHLVQGHHLGMKVSDAEYFAANKALTAVPEVFRSKEFLTLVSDVRRLDEAKEYLRTVNRGMPADRQMIFLSFRSRHLGTPDAPSAMGRLLVIVPGNPERWVQFGWGELGQMVRNISVVAVRRSGDGSAARTNVYFQDHYRTFQDDGSITIQSRHELGLQPDPCVNCHKGGVLPIFPESGSVSASELPILEATNQRVQATMPSAFGGYWNTVGPGLGATDELRQMAHSEGFFRRCVPAALAPRISEVAPKLRAAMRCATCHREHQAGSLNYPFDEKLTRSFVLGGRMPPGADLDPIERQALYDCLITDFFASETAGVLKAWLTFLADEAPGVP